jgi:protein-tyrosine phosphatase
MTASDNSESNRFLKADAKPRAPGFTDVHCHCLPGLDDGPEDMAQALQLCRALVEDGITRVVASPHQLGRFDGRCAAPTVRQAVAELQRKLGESGMALTLLPGADIRLDERIPQLLESDRIVTVGDGRRYLLLELPHEIFIDPLLLLKRLAAMGVTAVITHPERQEFLGGNPEWVSRWREYRPCLQITAASLTGEFGPPCEEAAWTFLQTDLPAVVATDAHDTEGRAPRMTAAWQKLSRRLGGTAADVLCVENPRRITTGQELVVLGGMLQQKGRRRWTGN